MEVGTNFRVAMPKYLTADPDYRIPSRQRSRYTHYFFYIRDQVLGPIALCVGFFLPFSITYYRNGHHFIEQQLRSAGIEFRKNGTRLCGWRTPKHFKRPPTPSAPS